MPLEVTCEGILPVEIHDTDLDDFEKVFGGLQRSDRRITLFRKLREYVGELRRANFQGFLIVDGSFVMSCVDEPDDIDVVLVLPTTWDLSADLKPFQYNLVSKRAVKRRFPIEVYPAIAGTESERKWIEFFSQINVKWYEPHGFAVGAQKGLVRIAI